MIQTKEHPRLIVNPFVIYIGFITAAGLLQHLFPISFVSSQVARVIGAALNVASLLFGLPSLRLMFRAKTSPNPNNPTTALISTGPYRFSRNPMYIGLTLMYTGLVIFLQFWWGLLLMPAVIALITMWVIQPEEQYLEQMFGETYRTYKKNVHRWI